MSGMIAVHTIPRAMVAHFEWVCRGALSYVPDFGWSRSSMVPTFAQGSAEWSGPPGSGATIVSAVRPWGRIRLDITEDPSPGRDGERFALTPTLGVFRATTSAIGDIVVTEDRLRAALDGPGPLPAAIDEMLGGPWDRELEIFRSQGDVAVVAAPTRIGIQSGA